MAEDFVIARNPEPDSSLPFLIRVPLSSGPIVLKAKERWPRTAKVYCHRATEWPDDADILERVPTRSCIRRGAAIDLVLDRKQESRSQLVLTYAKGREAIFWQTGRTAKQARPAARLPTARAGGVERFEIIVDSHERYPYRFSQQQVDVVRRGLQAGDYAVELDGAIVAAVERKSLTDLVASTLNGKLRYQLAELSAMPRAAVVVEDRWSNIFKLTYVRPAVAADAIAELQVRWPGVPIVFAETRSMAQEWTYRWLAAALVALREEPANLHRFGDLVTAGPLASASPSTAEVRAWAVVSGLPVPPRGRLRPEIWAAFEAAHPKSASTTA